jgi:flagellar hook-length control protein FliK
MTPSANLNPMATLQAQPTGKKQPGQATENSSFSQALSNEIAQKKSSEAKQNESRSEARKAAESRSEPAPPDSTAAQDAAPTETATSDPLKTATTENSAPQPDGQPVAAAIPLLPDAMLAMAAAPALLMPPSAPTGNTIETEPALLAHAPVLPAPLSAPAPATLADPLADAVADAQTAARQPAKADFQAAMTPASAHATATAAAAALPGQIATALSTDALKPDETRADSIGNPLLSAAQFATLGTASTPASAASNTLAPSVGSAAWSQALGEKIVWMTAGALQTASLTLNPPNLGPLQVVLNVTNDQATASFFAAQPEVRQALEAALPKLREMMNEAGIQLGQATVGAEQQQQQQNEAASREARRMGLAYPGADDAAESTLQSMPLPIRQSGRGLVDTFA